VGFEPTMRLPP